MSLPGPQMSSGVVPTRQIRSNARIGYGRGAEDSRHDCASAHRLHARVGAPTVCEGSYEEMESRSSRSTSAQTMTITSRLIAILSSIPRQGPTVGDGTSVATATCGFDAAPRAQRPTRREPPSRPGRSHRSDAAQPRRAARRQSADVAEGRAARWPWTDPAPEPRPAPGQR